MATEHRINELLDLAREHYEVPNDHQLARRLDVEPSLISRMRHGKHMPPQAHLILTILNTVVPGPLPKRERVEV
jgi:predicted transcriptional regulator